MKSNSRTKLALHNSVISGFVTLLNFPIQFINRFFMVHYLGVTYLGITSLFTNILSVLSLADLGIGSAIVFLLYKPLAEHDLDKLSILMRYYRNIYRTIAGIVFLLGMLLIPFLPIFLKNYISYTHVYGIYLVYLLGSSSSYLFSYNQSLLYANQQNFVVYWINLIVTYVMLSIQIYTVIIFRNRLLYAALFVFSNFVTNLFVTLYVNHNYKLKKIKGKLSLGERKLLIQNVIGNFFLRVSGVVVTSTDSVLLSIFTGVVQVGLYANYVTITNVIQKIISQVIGAISGSIGNFAVTKNKKQSERLFNNLQYLNFIILNISVLGILFLSKDVISLWLGEKYVLNSLDVFLIGISFYLMNYRVLGWSFISIYGLAQYMKAFSVNEMISNIVFSLFYVGVLKLGLTGVLLGTISSTLTTVMWQDPYIIFHHAFNSSMKPYFTRYVYNIIILLIEASLISFIANNISINNHFCSFIILLCIVLGIGIIFPIIFYWNSDEFKFMFQILKRIVREL